MTDVISTFVPVSNPQSPKSDYSSVHLPNAVRRLRTRKSVPSDERRARFVDHRKGIERQIQALLDLPVDWGRQRSFGQSFQHMGQHQTSPQSGKQETEKTGNFQEHLGSLIQIVVTIPFSMSSTTRRGHVSGECK